MGRDAALDELSAQIQGVVEQEPDRLERFSRDASAYHCSPRGCVQPKDTEEVVRVVQWARRHRIPLVGRGGGSSLAGESVPPAGGVVVDFSPWTSLLEVDEPNRLARVQPGIVNRELHRALVARGLFFPPNPGSWTFSTIGGNVATNASGMRSFRYGPTRAWVRGIEAVLGTGERIRIGHRARKSSTGPGLLGFLVGSEGTLALFTEITLGLAPLPATRLGIVIPLPADRAPGELAAALVGSTLRVSALEYADAATAQALSSASSHRFPADTPLLLVELESDDDEPERLIESAEAWLSAHGLGGRAELFPQADELWTLRGQSGELIERRLGPHLREDVAVPLSRVGELLEAIQRIAVGAHVEVQVYGHLGEGSLHPHFAVDPMSDAARAIRRDLLLAARRLGGTISGEHGIGLSKAPYLALEHGSEGAALLARLKQTFDPDGILNPGKLYPPPIPASG